MKIPPEQQNFGLVSSFYAQKACLHSQEVKPVKISDLQPGRGSGVMHEVGLAKWPTLGLD